jgi:hypothetical protein
MTEQTRAALPVWMALVKPKCACCIQSEHVTHEQPEAALIVMRKEA